MTYYTSKGFLEDVLSDIIIIAPQRERPCSREEIVKALNRQVRCVNLFGRLRSLGLDIELHSDFVKMDDFHTIYLNRLDRLYSKHSEILKNLPELYEGTESDVFLESLEALLDAGIPISQILEDM